MRAWIPPAVTITAVAAVMSGVVLMAQASTGNPEDLKAAVSRSFTILKGDHAAAIAVRVTNAGTYTGPADCEVWGFGKPGQHIATGWGLLDRGLEHGQSAVITVKVLPASGHLAVELTGFTASCWGSE